MSPDHEFHMLLRTAIVVLLSLGILAGCKTPATPPEGSPAEPAEGAPAQPVALAPAQPKATEKPVAAGPVDIPRFRFGHIANPLIDWEGRNTMFLSADSDMLFYDALAQLHRPSRVDLLVLGGNCIHNTGKGATDLALLQRRLRDCRFPTLAVLGPRDTRSVGAGQIQRGELQGEMRGHELPSGTPYYQADPAPRLHFLILDSTEFASGKGGRIGAAQLAWLERQLAAIPLTDAAVVFCHHMLFPVWTEPMAERFSENLLENADEVRALLGRYQVVKLVCTSSLGVPSTHEEAGLHYVCTPALGFYPCAFRRFTIQGNRIDIETLDLTERKVDTLAMVALREDPNETWKYYDFKSPDQLAQFLRGRNEDWQLSLTMR